MRVTALLCTLALLAAAEEETRRLVSPNGKHAIETDLAPDQAHVFDKGGGAILRRGLRFIHLDASGASLHAHVVPGAHLWWVDEERERLIVLHAEGRLLTFSLVGSGAGEGGLEDLRRGLLLAHARASALHAGAVLRSKELAEAAAAITADETQPEQVRLCAAALVERTGGEEVAAELFAGDSRRTLEIAALLDRREFLETIARREGMDVAVLGALEWGGPAAAKIVLSILSDEKTTPSGRIRAIATLGALDADAVFDAVTADLDEAPVDLAGTLVSGLLATGAKGLERKLQPHQTKLVEVLDREAASIDWLAGYFEVNPTTEAVKPLLRALRRHARRNRTSTAILRALRTCTGLDYGEDPRDWLEKLR